MKRTIISVLMAAGLVALAVPGCLEEKVLDIVLTSETSYDFHEDQASTTWATPVVVEIGKEIQDLLDKNGYNVAHIKSAHVTSASYGVVDFPPHADWTISGEIQVTYGTQTETVLSYTSQSIQGALGRKIPATLGSAAVNLMNQALSDFLSGQTPVLVFTVVNGSVTPAPTPVDHIIFDWRAWLGIQVIIDQKVEVPDPF